MRHAHWTLIVHAWCRPTQSTFLDIENGRKSAHLQIHNDFNWIITQDNTDFCYYLLETVSTCIEYQYNKMPPFLLQSKCYGNEGEPNLLFISLTLIRLFGVIISHVFIYCIEHPWPTALWIWLKLYNYRTVYVIHKSNAFGFALNTVRLAFISIWDHTVLSQSHQ